MTTTIESNLIHLDDSHLTKQVESFERLAEAKAHRDRMQQVLRDAQQTKVQMEADARRGNPPSPTKWNTAVNAIPLHKETLIGAGRDVKRAERNLVTGDTGLAEAAALIVAEVAHESVPVVVSLDPLPAGTHPLPWVNVYRVADHAYKAIGDLAVRDQGDGEAGTFGVRHHLEVGLHLPLPVAKVEGALRASGALVHGAGGPDGEFDIECQRVIPARAPEALTEAEAIRSAVGHIVPAVTGLVRQAERDDSRMTLTANDKAEASEVKATMSVAGGKRRVVIEGNVTAASTTWDVDQLAGKVLPGAFRSLLGKGTPVLGFVQDASAKPFKFKGGPDRLHWVKAEFEVVYEFALA